jgi:hypothetical protein
MAVITTIFGGFSSIVFEQFVIYVIAGVGVYFVVTYLTDNTNKTISTVCGIFSASIFTLTIINLPYFNSFATVTLFYPYVILFMAKFVEDIRRGNRRSIFLPLSIFSFGANIGFTGAPYILQNILFLLFLSTGLLLTLKKNRLFFLSSVLLILLFGIVLNFPTVITTIFTINKYKIQIISTSSTILTENQLSFPISLISFMIGNYALQTNQKISINATIIGIVILLISILSLIPLSKVKKINVNVSIQFFLIVYMIFCIIMLASIGPPLGILYSYLTKFIPYLAVFRIPYLSWSPSYFLVLSILFGVSCKQFMIKPFKFKILGIVILTLIVVYYVYLTDFLLLSTVPRTQIPNYVWEISTFIAHQDQSYYPIGIVPASVATPQTNWYYGTNIYAGIIQNSAVYDGSVDYGGDIFSLTTEEYFYAISQINSQISNVNLKNLFGVFGIRYIIVETDIVNRVTFSQYSNYSNPFNLSLILYNINSSGLYPIKKYSGAIVYNNSNAAPLVYPTNLYVISNASLKNVVKQINKKNFNISNTSIFSSNLSSSKNEPFGWPNSYTLYYNNTIQPVTISYFKEPIISFVRINPTTFKVNIKNATTPFYLILRESYDPDWKAKIIGGKLLPVHIAVNGFANAWYIDKPGNYTISLYYTLQTEAWIAWIISFAGLGITLYIGYLGWKEMKKEKRVVGMLNRIEREGSGK